MIGHSPVVDGVTGFRDGDPGSRWVVCDRCGVRPDPQGSLDPADWNIGDEYPFSWPSDDLPTDEGARFTALKNLKGVHYSPGQWPITPTGTLGGQIVLATRDTTTGITLKVGNQGSEHTLAASVHLPWIGAIYLHTERFGAGLVRRLNPVGYHSRVIELRAHDGHLFWKLWGKRDHSRNDPRWMGGSVQIDPRSILLGPKRYSNTDNGAKVTATVHLPHGDQHPVQLQLQRQTFGRKRGRKNLSWSVDWQALRGIPTGPGGHGRICGSGVAIPDDAVAAGNWPAVATARIAERLGAERSRNNWQPAAKAS
ncbi:hypothetical protein [Micromonospora arborensis]|uniref:hypothetical protein n=1 Tax=Micromonospora arborensis TaxID=2116518 RepID=UPI00371DFD10